VRHVVKGVLDGVVVRQEFGHDANAQVRALFCQGL
jgi:hypothetical protein